jgi:hypothetical protein
VLQVDGAPKIVHAPRKVGYCFGTPLFIIPAMDLIPTREYRRHLNGDPPFGDGQAIDPKPTWSGCVTADLATLGTSRKT